MHGNVLTGERDMREDIRALDRRMDQLESPVEPASQVAAYNGPVVGHGMLTSEPDARLYRVEQRFELQPSGPSVEVWSARATAPCCSRPCARSHGRP